MRAPRRIRLLPLAAMALAPLAVHSQTPAPDVPAVAGAIPRVPGDSDTAIATPSPMRRAEALRAQRRLTEALAVYEAVLAADPNDDGAYRMRAITLADLGSATLAAEAAARRPQAFARHELERLQGDRVARMIGWGRADPEDPARRFAESEAALATLRALQRDDPRRTRWEATRLRVDALSALNHLQRHAEVVDGYCALRDEGIEVPGYILGTVGDSLLALRQPEQAVPVLEAALAYRPGDVNASILLGYAWLEQERFDRAMPIFEALAARQPAWPRRAGASRGYENWDRFGADLNLALARSHGNDQAGAERVLHALESVGPDNADLQAGLGAVESRRQRPSAALQRYGMARTLDPWHRDAHAGRLGALLALNRVGDARAAYDDLRARFPEDPRLDRIGRDLQRHVGWQATLSASRGRSALRDEAASSASPFGSRDGGWALSLRSPLLADRWRVGVQAQEQWADFERREPDPLPDRVRYRSAGIGLYYRHDRLGAAATVSRVVDDVDDGATAATLSADWRFSDVWRGTFDYARKDPDASLQARRLGITADSVAVGAAWTPSESTAVEGRLARFRYEDGNDRDALQVAARQRLVARPHLLLDGLVSGYASRSSLGADAPYFNPERDASLSAGLRLDHIAWRRYETAFQQRVELSAGPYWQRGYGTHWVPALGYRHLWRRDGHELEYGVSWSRPVYDGAREQRIAFDVVLRWGGEP